MQLNFKPQPAIVAKILVGIAVIIATLSLITEYIVEFALAREGSALLIDFLDLFSVNLEESFPTWYSVLILFIASVLLSIITWGKYREGDSFRRYWVGLALLFLYFSMDEGVAIHEILADPLQIAFDADGFFTFGWQIVAFPLVAIFGLLYLRFTLHLPSKTRNLFIASAVLYAGGALIIEGISANQWSRDDTISMTYIMIATIEELCEILGVSLFIYTLLGYIQIMGYSVSFADIKTEDVSRSPQAASTIPPVSSRLPMILIIVLLLITNAVSIIWIMDDNAAPQIQAPVAFYDPLQLDETLVTEMQTLFGPSNTPSLKFAASLLDVYPEIMIVVMPALEQSVVFSGDTLSFNRDELIDLLHANGQVEFVIYETDVVRVFTSSLDEERPE